MYINSSDIACFLYCPYIRKYKNAKEIVMPKPTLLQQAVGKAIRAAELNCMLKNSDLTPRKILRVWDKLWWPYVAENNIPMKDAKNVSVKASSIFSDYCKYDISDFTKYITIGSRILETKQLGNLTLESEIDVIKIDMTTKKNINLIDFSRKSLTNREIVLDPEIRAKVYCFYQDKEEDIIYTHVSLNSKDKLNISSVIFRPTDMEEIRKMILLAKTGIENNINYMNKWNCKECKQCPNSK